MIDNRDIVRRFIDPVYDGDTFWYTELIDREGNGAARYKLLRTFEHQTRDEFDAQMDTIAMLCERNQVRAYTRLSPRSRKRVAVEMLKRVALEFTDGHYQVFGRIYASVLGSTSVHRRKLWLLDVDAKTELAERACELLSAAGTFRGIVPSRKGYHIITAGCEINKVLGPLWPHWVPELTIHKDNPTNLYIPENAK